MRGGRARRRPQLDPGGGERRGEADRHGGDRGRGEEEAHRPAVQGEAGEARRGEARDRAYRPCSLSYLGIRQLGERAEALPDEGEGTGRERQGEDRSEDGQERALGAELAEDAPAAGAQGGAERQLPAAPGSARNQQVGDAAGGEEPEEERRGEGEEGPRLRLGADHPVGERRHPDPAGAGDRRQLAAGGTPPHSAA